MMKHWFMLFLLLLPIVTGAHGDEPEHGAWLVVVNQNASVSHLSQKQVMSLFLGRAQFLPNGSRVKTFDFPADSKIRAGFYHYLTGKNIADIDAYWARLKYSGRASPPLALANSNDIIKKVSEHETALAYLPSALESSLAANGLKVVLTVGAH